MADHIGRRSTLLISVIPLFMGWSMLALSQNYAMLLAGRLLCGFATGILGGPAQVCNNVKPANETSKHQQFNQDLFIVWKTLSGLETNRCISVYLI